MPTEYSDEQLAVAKQTFEKARGLIPMGAVYIAEDHRRAHPRGLVANLINRAKIRRLYLELPAELDLEMLKTMSMMENVLSMGNPSMLSEFTKKFNEDKKNKNSSAAAGEANGDSATAASTTLNDKKNIAEWIRELQLNSADGRLNLRDNPIWGDSIKCALDSHFDIAKNAVPLSRLIEHAVANAVEVKFFDRQAHGNQLDADRQKSMFDKLGKENIKSGDLVLVGHDHVDKKHGAVRLGNDNNVIQAIHDAPAGAAR